jgi:hypothetical protein
MWDKGTIFLKCQMEGKKDIGLRRLGWLGTSINNRLALGYVYILYGGLGVYPHERLAG